MRLFGGNGVLKLSLYVDQSGARGLLTFLCIGVLFITLTLGLWPFHARQNGVTWIPERSGIRFDKDSTVLSSGPLRLTNSQNPSGTSLEIWLQPNRIWDSGTLLAFSKGETPSRFSLRQEQSDLSLRVFTEDEHQHSRAEALRVKDAFRRLPPSHIKSAPSFITVTSGGKGVLVYVEGTLAAVHPRFPLSSRDFNARFVVGDSTGQPDSWKGQLFGLAVYRRQLTQAEIWHHYTTWKQNGKPELPKRDGNLALYLFDEHKGNVVRDRAHSGVDLYMPEKYEVRDKIALEPLWTEFSMTRSYWSAALKNVVGFIPFGISFYAYFSVVRSLKRSLPLTAALGLGVSLTIEILQAFLPNRDSGTSDLIANLLGTWIGAMSYRVLMPRMARVFPKAASLVRHQ